MSTKLDDPPGSRVPGGDHPPGGLAAAQALLDDHQVPLRRAPGVSTASW